MIYALSILGGVIFRMRGGWPKIPRPIEQALFCLPVIYAAWGAEWWLIGIVYGLSVAAVCKGHGNSMDLGTWKEPVKYEWYEIHRALDGKISAYWYDVIGMAISGLTYTLPLVLVNPWAALIGIAKAPAYMIGWAFDLPKIRIYKWTLQEPTEWGEFLTGFFVWALLIYAGVGVHHD